MNVLYDISTLGFGHTLASSRTGIFRVVEHGAEGLLDSEKCHVSFCASQSNYLQCTQYLQSQPKFSSVRLNVPDDPLSRIYSLIEPARIDVHKHSFHVLKNDFVRFVYHAGKKFTWPISRRDIVGADIYHSPANPIPEQIHIQKKIATFITIYDITPLLFSHTYPTLSQMAMKIILDSIRPETFVMCISQHTKNDLCTYLPGLDPERVKISHLAAGDHFYQCTDVERIGTVRKKCGIPDGASYMLALSTLQPRKNFSRTIRCFVKVLKESRARDLYLAVVGATGWDYEDILVEIEKAGEFRNRILLTGYLPDEDLAPLYSGSLAFLYLSFYEGFGLPPLEAMQCGTAVLTSNTSSLPEVVGDAGIMVDPEDDDAICSAMLELYSDSALRADLVQKSVQQAKQFSWTRYNDQVISAYQNAL